MADLMRLAEQFLSQRSDLVGKGMKLYWIGVDGRERGPVEVAGTFRSQGELWCWFTYEEQERLINVRLITRVAHDPYKPKQGRR